MPLRHSEEYQSLDTALEAIEAFMVSIAKDIHDLKQRVTKLEEHTNDTG